MSYEKTDKNAQRRSRFVRVGILTAVLAVITVLARLHQTVNTSAKPVPIDALCPFGGLETLYSIIAGGGYIEKVAASSIVLLLAAVGLALVYRRSFCGQLCPLGALQGAFGWVGRTLIRKRPTLPKVLDRPARWLKYVVLAVFTVWTWMAGTLVMRAYDPWAAYAHITSEEVLTTFGIGLAVLGVSLVASIVYDRFFCKYLCPMGALLSIFSKVSFLRIRRDADACIDCGRCDKACPMNVGVSTAHEVTSPECISCNECVNACPVKGALEVKAGSGSHETARSLAPLTATGLVVAILAASIGVATFVGDFRWTMPSLAESAHESASSPGAAFDVSLIKGYMSMGEIAEAAGVPREEFTKKYGVPDSDLDKPMKEIKDTYGFSPDDVRTWVEEYLAGK